jgi:hypothetical protein
MFAVVTHRADCQAAYGALPHSQRFAVGTPPVGRLKRKPLASAMGYLTRQPTLSLCRPCHLLASRLPSAWVPAALCTCGMYETRAPISCAPNRANAQHE